MEYNNNTNCVSFTRLSPCLLYSHTTVRGNAQFTVSYLDSQELAGPEVEAVIGRDLTVLNSITLVNGQVDFDIGEGLSVAFWAKILFDNEYFESGFALGVFGGLAQRNVGAPRTYGVRLNKSF